MPYVQIKHSDMRSKRRSASRCVAVVLALSVASGYASDEPTDWLMRINRAAKNLSFAGNFVYLHNNQVEAMQVVRRVKNGNMQERLYALNGDAREVVRDQHRVWCYIPDKNIGVYDYRQISESGFPNILPGDLSALQLHYVFEHGGQARIANRLAKQIKVAPKDKFRYGYHLWADKETGLLLRSDLVDRQGNIVEQYLFVNIDIGIEIKDAELEASTAKAQLVWYGADRPNLSPQISSVKWQLDNPPAGYRLSRHIRRMTPMAMQEEHLVFTDGLSTVSVFIKKAQRGQSDMKGLSRMGAVHAYRHSIAGHLITVMGEVPAETVKQLAQQVRFHP